VELEEEEEEEKEEEKEKATQPSLIQQRDHGDGS
jgi:hypothetical protein